MTTTRRQAPSATANPSPLRAELPNGLRVLMEPVAGAPRVAVCVTYGVGFRSERPGQEGLAHLFEHLMFRGSENLPPGRFYDHIHPLGGEANGTTHQDYTDYYQTVPSAALEPALFAEADRMRAPLLTEAVLAEQLAGVEREISDRILDRPLGDVPWPLLPRALFDRHANAHDGFGDITRLRGVTQAECATFFHQNYAPGNAVLTLVGGFEPDTALGLVARHFGDVAARPVPPRPDLTEHTDDEDRWLRCTQPRIPATVVALGHRLPGPDLDLDHYVATMVMARIVADRGAYAAPGRPLRVSSGCGFFGPLDALTPDALITTSVLPDDVSPERFVEAVADALPAGRDALEPAVARTRLRLASEHARAHGDLTTRCRSLGRLEQLFGRAELVDEIPARLAAVTRAQVAAAAEHLRKAPRGVLVVEPGPVRSRPVDRQAGEAKEAAEAKQATGQARQETGQARQAGEARAAGRERLRHVRAAAARPPAPRAPSPRPAPTPGTPGSPVLRSAASEVLDTGLLVSVVEDHRTPLAEIRLRAPLGPAGLLAPAAVDTLVRSLWPPAAEAHRGADPLSLVVRRSPDGLCVEATGYASAAALAPLLPAVAELATVLRAAALPPGTETPEGLPPGGTPDGAMDALLCATTTRRPAGRRPAGATTRIPLTAGAGCLTIVGPTGAADVLDTLRAHGDARSPRAADHRPAWGEAAAVVRRERPGGSGHGRSAARALLCAPEPAAGDDEAARYLAAAVLGLHLRKHLPEALGRLGGDAPATCDIRVGRDVFLGLPRAWVRAYAPGTEPDLLLTALRTVTNGLGDGPDASDVRRAATFCAAQMLAVFDSPAALADALARFGTSGWRASTLAGFSDRLRTVSPARVSDAVAHLYRPAMSAPVHRFDHGRGT
ncbi:insulinase family protein [Streptomyces sp. WG5]|uniref:M16 family metallopeptidase n=1 Tax=Streptomyces sp. WG5 TaxID=3417648 RepID=UPI003CEE8582